MAWDDRQDTGPNGERRDVKGVIPDFDLVVWEGRRVIIALTPTRTRTSKLKLPEIFWRVNYGCAERKLRVTWDIAQGKGIDDLLANVGPGKVLELLGGADFEKEESEDNISVHQMAEAITARHRFAQDAGGRLYVYRGGVYHAEGSSFVAQQVKRLLVRLKLASKWTSHKSDEVVKYLTVDAPLLWEKPPIDQVNVLNGILDVNTRSLSPHSADFLSPVQLPVTFDPTARCPGWKQFIR